MHQKLKSLNIKIFADGADELGITQLCQNPLIKGVTTNPTLMRKAGIKNYSEFAKSIIKLVPHLPVSFEVFADELPEMERQAKAIASWGKNVNVKIPVMNTKGEFTGPIIESLSSMGVVLNVTAIMTVDQVQAVAKHLSSQTPAIISVFAGRIADTGLDPMLHMKQCLQVMNHLPKAELLWASPRELLNIFQANDVGCHIITVGHDLLGKLSLVGKNLHEYSRETVEMFYRDALASSYQV
jgi:transaldolase